MSIPAGAEIRACPTCGIRSWEEHKGARHRPGCPHAMDAEQWPGSLVFVERFYERWPGKATPKAAITVGQGRCKLCGAILRERELRGFCEGPCRGKRATPERVAAVTTDVTIAPPVTTAVTTAACKFCEKPVPQPKGGGRAKEFCSTAHRVAWHRMEKA